jgi:4'-phosphopantetheinyl transferase
VRSERLSGDEVHVWRASLDQPPELISTLSAFLSEDERERVRRIPIERLRARIAVARGLLRTLLGRYSGSPPEAVQFGYGTHGKPFLIGSGPWFNLSHSGGVALYAFSPKAEVGVDVELVGRRVSALRIAERFFSEAEARTLRSLPEDLQARAFLTCWTRKEAFIKARGDGLTLPLGSFDVAFAPSERAAVLRTAWSMTEPAEWRLEDLSDPAAGTIAAVAVRERRWHAVRREAADVLDDLAGARARGIG